MLMSILFPKEKHQLRTFLIASNLTINEAVQVAIHYDDHVRIENVLVAEGEKLYLQTNAMPHWIQVIRSSTYYNLTASSGTYVLKETLRDMLLRLFSESPTTLNRDSDHSAGSTSQQHPSSHLGNLALSVPTIPSKQASLAVKPVTRCYQGAKPTA